MFLCSLCPVLYPCLVLSKMYVQLMCLSLYFIWYKRPFPFFLFSSSSTGRQLDKPLLHWRSAPYYSPIIVLLFSCVVSSVIWRNKVLNLESPMPSCVQELCKQRSTANTCTCLYLNQKMYCWQKSITNVLLIFICLYVLYLYVICNIYTILQTRYAVLHWFS